LNVAETTAQEPWCWRDFGAHLMLVTKHRGAKVILAPNTYALQTRCQETGVLRPLHADDDVARVIAAAPEAVSLARIIVKEATHEETSTHVATYFDEDITAQIFRMAERIVQAVDLPASEVKE
jgi:collagenase-like PrtC family protease